VSLGRERLGSSTPKTGFWEAGRIAIETRLASSTPDGYTECFGGAKLLGYVQATDN
jgi:hypothetical protein